MNLGWNIFGCRILETVWGKVKRVCSRGFSLASTVGVFYFESVNRKPPLFLGVKPPVMMLRSAGPGPARKASICCVSLLGKCRRSSRRLSVRKSPDNWEEPQQRPGEKVREASHSTGCIQPPRGDRQSPPGDFVSVPPPPLPPSIHVWVAATLAGRGAVVFTALEGAGGTHRSRCSRSYRMETVSLCQVAQVQVSRYRCVPGQFRVLLCSGKIFIFFYRQFKKRKPGRAV